jgi:acyl-CoA synthetase (NDP forming)
MDREQVRAIIDQKLETGAGWLSQTELYSLLTAAGIPVASVASVTNVYDAVAEAMRTGFPVALKAQGSTLLHKSEAGAVKLGLQDEREVREAYLELQSRLGARMESAIVQQMIADGVEVMVGATADPMFGHVVVYGAGGTLVELLADVSTRINPLTDRDAEDMIEELRSSKLLRGFRGAPAVDRAAARDVLLRVSALLTICPEIRELDINPLKVLERGAVAVDARIRVDTPPVVAPTRRIAY